MLVGLLMYTNRQVQDLSALQDKDRILALFSFLVISGTLIGFFSTYYAVKRYLKMSLDDLY
jgi:cell division transport system permease protein